ncbi:MAG: hypothetical protein SynsKO_43650 [Synoicihabitans sp.]
MKRIDAHIHAYPAEVFADPQTWGKAHVENWWAESVAPTGRPSIQGWADVDTLIRDMDDAGIDQAVMLGWYWEHQSTCEEQNTWMHAWRSAHPDRLIAFAAVNPSAGRAALAQTRRWLDLGFQGIGELLDRVQGFRYADDNFAAVVDLAQAYHVPFNLHVTDPKLNARPSMQPTPLEDFTALATQFPQTNFILAHLGGGLPWRASKSLPTNLYFDTAAVPLIYDTDCYGAAINQVGADRILFGTDYPLRTFPREARQPEFSRAVKQIQQLDLTPHQFDAIMGSNLLNLLPRD